MEGLAREELSALEAIFCGPGEWEMLSQSETDGTVFRILTEAEGPPGSAVPLELLFHLPPGYPSCLPGISISSERLTRAQCAAARDRLLEHARSLVPEPMVHELVLWAQQNLGHALPEPGPGGGPGRCPCAASAAADGGPWLALLRLDHMRARTQYARSVRRWACSLGLTGRLMFLGKAILILLQGRRDSLKEYLALQRTSKVDVDASGKKCKERMVSVLFETQMRPEHTRFLEFEVREYSSLDELRAEFQTAGLETLFSEFVPGLVK